VTSSPTTTTAPAPVTPCRGASGQISPASNGHRLPSTAHGYHHEAADPADGTGEIAALRVENTNLRAQVASLPVIEQAKGILIGRYQISPDAAFALLQRWSSHTNIKLRDISGLLVDAASQPDGQAPGRNQHCRDLEPLIDWLKSGGKTEQTPRDVVRRARKPLTNPTAEPTDAATIGTDPHDKESPS
jgi:hypothetical protein